ncbi:MAG TPA: class I SAM-dependent methyltransferase [Mycobacteriales bacterium]|nr:class I SAM-dependent methyltransferase [Mycobacteriales bacterium]
MTAPHWDAVYAAKTAADLSWTQPEPAASLRLVTGAVPAPGSVIDIGAGTSTLIEHLLAAGYPDLTALDVSAHALALAQQRLGPTAEQVCWLVADLLAWEPSRTYDGWHDRAVIHFLVDPHDRDRYIALATRAVAGGGAIVIGTFAADGPAQCSGLPTARYDADALGALFAPTFALEHTEREQHQTPWGVPQSFTWVVLRHRG